MRGNGDFTVSSFDVSRSSTFSSVARLSSTRDTTDTTSASARSIVSSSVAYAISGSTIQNSVR